MKIKHLFVGMLALAAAVACKEDQPVETPKLDVDKTAVTLTATAGEATFNVTSNLDWTASADADWVSVDPATGKASSKAVAVKVTAEDNETEEVRSATVTVKAGELTKTLKLTQAAGEATEPEPEPTGETYILVGEAVGGWNVDENGVVLELKDGYYFKAEVGVTAKKGMHFTKNNKWEGNVKGLHGLIAPNEIGEVGNNDISLTTGGAYDVYLTEALDKFYFMSPGKTPAEAVEHVEISTVWGVCGAIDGNGWGAAADPEMTEEGEWFVAKNITFTEVNFKVRGNNSWADDLKWGCATKNQVCKINEAIAVSTCTEFKAANEGEGDNPNIYIGGAGTYDIYFSAEKKEVWVMTPGYKPGDETPEPDPVDVTYTVAGTITDNAWSNNAEIGLMTLEGDYYVVKNLPLVWSSTLYTDNTNNAFELKVLETGTWNAYGSGEGAAAGAANTEIPVVYGGNNIVVEAAEGTYDVYFDKTNEKVWVMTAGYKPGDDVPTPEPEPSYEKVSGTEVTEWGADAMAALFAQYGKDEVTEDFVYEKLYFSVGGGKFKFGENSNAAGEKVARFQFGGKGDYESGKNIVKFFVPGPGTLKVEGISSGDAARPLMVAIDGTVTSEAGYELPDKTQTPIVVEVDCSTAVDGSEIAVWSGNSGLNIFSIKWIPAGVTEPEPEPELDVDIDGKQWTFNWEGMGGIPAVIDLGVTKQGTAILAFDMGVLDPSYDGVYFPYIFGDYTVTKTDGTSGVITLSDETLTIDIPYNNATETTVHFESAALLEGENIDCTLVTDPIYIDTSTIDVFADGDYWIMSNGKVATPLTGSYGYLQTIDAEGGKSYASNAFTFTCVDATEMLYAIQDSNGKYLYQTGTYNSFNVAETFDTADDGYYWSVIAMGDGTYYIANYNTMKTMQYDSGYGSFGCYDEMKGVYPELVLAEDPIAEPEPDDPSTTYTKIESVADLSAGTYYMAAYLTTDSNGTDLSSHPYHLCTGVSTDLYTASYAYTDGSLVVKEESTFLPVDVVLEAVEGKENTYAIKISGKYLYSTEYSNRKLASGDTPVEWVATDNANGGVTMTTTLSEGTISMGSASATSKFIRSYKNESTLKYGLVFFKKN